MEGFFADGFSAFSCTGQGQPLLRDETAACWQTIAPDGSRALLWRVWLSRQTLEAAWGVAQGRGEQLWAQAPALVRGEMEKLRDWTLQQPGVFCTLRQLEVQPYLLDPELLELHLLTDWALPLTAARPAGIPDREAAAALMGEVCRALDRAQAAGLAPACLSPDRVLLNEQGAAVLAPVWPGMDQRPAEGFSVQGSAEQRQGYSAAMLLFWLLNGGAVPFAEDAACLQDAERRRLAGEALPPLPAAGQALNEVLARLCRVPPGEDCRVRALEEALDGLKTPGREEEQRRQEEERRAAEEEERLRREEEEQQLRRDREKARRLAEKDLGSDRGDRRALGLLVAGAAAVVAVVCLFLATRATSLLQKNMTAGNYATALEQIEEGYRQGENVDELVELYAEECIGNGEYIRAMAAYDYLSAEAEPEEEQLRRLVELTLQSGEERRAARFLDDLVQKGGPGGETATRLQQEFNEELG